MAIRQGKPRRLKALDEIGDMPVQIVSMPDNLDQMVSTKNGPEDLAYPLTKTRISRLGSTFTSISLKIVKICRHRLS